MKYKNIFCLVLVVLFFLTPIPTTQSCGYSAFETEDYRVALFNPKVLNESKFEPFYFTSAFLNRNYIDPKIDQLRNCEEWKAQFRERVLLEDVYTIIYRVNRNVFLEAYEEGTLLTAFPQNTFIAALVKPKYRGLLDYLKMAFWMEYSNAQAADLWGLEEDIKNKELPENLENTLQNTLNSSKNFFLRERYAYQLVVAHRYNGEYAACNAVFDKYLKGSKSILAAWGYLHKGKALYELGQVPQSNLALALAFDGCESKKIRAIQGFSYEQLNETLALTQNPKERVAIAALSKLNYPGAALDAIQTVITYRPDYDYLPLLIQREINKIENWLLAPFLMNTEAILDVNYEKEERDYYRNWRVEHDKAIGFDYKNKYYSHKNHQKDVAYLRKFRAKLLQLLQKNGAKPHQDFLNLAIAHLYFLDFDYNKAWNHLNKVAANAAPAIQSQVHIDKVLVLSQLRDIADKNTQTLLHESLDWLQEHHELIENYERTIGQLHLHLSRTFHKQGKMVEAGLLYMQIKGAVVGGSGITNYYRSIAFFDKYASLTDIDETLAFVNKKNKTPFEKYLMNDIKKINTMNGNYGHRLLELQGTIAFRQEKLEKALACFSKLPDNYWRDNYEFSYYLEDPFENWDKAEDGKGKYRADKAKIIKRMLDLQNNGLPENLLLLAEVYWECTDDGDSWMMFSYGNYPSDKYRSGAYFEYSFYPNSETYEEVYYYLGRAKKYYQKVAGHRSATLEQKALATYYLGKIDRFKYNATTNYWDRNKKYIPAHFLALQRDFKKANNYNWLMSCTGMDGY